MESNKFTEVYLIVFASDEREAILDAENFLTAEGFTETLISEVGDKEFLVEESVPAQEILDFLRENKVNNFKLGATIFEEMVKGYEGGFYPSPKMARLYADLRSDILNPKSKVYCESHRTHNIRECLEFPDGWYAVRVKINFGI